MRTFIAVLLIGMLAACSPSADDEAGGDPVGAYEAIVEWLYVTDDGLNGRIFAIDPSGTGLPHPSALVDALGADPRYADHKVMSATREDLEEQGLIVDDGLWFEDGFLIEFSNPEITGTRVTVDGQKWASGLGAIYATLTANWDGEAWVVEEPTSVAIA